MQKMSHYVSLQKNGQFLPIYIRLRGRGGYGGTPQRNLRFPPERISLVRFFVHYKEMNINFY